MDRQLGPKLVAEFIGTFALIFMGAGAIIVGSGLIGIALAHGLTIALMITAMGHVSGGAFNPAVAIGLWATRRLSNIEVVGYILAELAGGIAGAAALLLFPEALRDVASGVPSIAGVTFVQAAVIEAILTFFLMLTIMGTAIDSRAAKVGGFAIGLMITVDILAAGRLTGAVMNPARAFGPELVNGVWDDALVYWVGPIIGAVLAALTYHYVLLDDTQRAEVGAAS